MMACPWPMTLIYTWAARPRPAILRARLIFCGCHADRWPTRRRPSKSFTIGSFTGRFSRISLAAAARPMAAKRALSTSSGPGLVYFYNTAGAGGQLGLDVLEDEGAGFLRGQGRGVDDAGAEGDHERGGGARAVALVAGGEILADAFRGAAAAAGVKTSVKIEFEIRFRKDVRADVAPFHDEVAELDTFALMVFHPFAHGGHGGDMRDGSADLGAAYLFSRIVAIHEKAHGVVAAFKGGFPFAAQRGHRRGVVRINFFLQAMPR